jgi:hypothetical protein
MTHKFSYLFLAGFFTITLCKSQDKILFLKINYDSIRIVLEKVYDRDQNIRRMLQDSIGHNSNGFLISRMITIDSENQNIVIPLLDKYGLRPKSKIGNKANDAVFFVIQHSNLELMEKYFPIFDSLARKGETNRIHVAMMEDRLLMWKGLKQKYGTQANSFKKTGDKMMIWPIEQPDKVDSLRKAVGFNNTI